MAKGTTITTTGVLYINGEQVEGTFKNISKVTKKLESELRALKPGTQEFIDKAAEVRQARTHFEAVKSEINAATTALRAAEEETDNLGRGFFRFGEIFRGVFSANIAVDFFHKITSKGRETVDQLLEVADAMTDVEKTSGMTREQVKQLWDEFDRMDTRTSKLDRLKIAETAGRLGVAHEEMASFVQEIDKAYVALGDSFEGGLEQVVKSLGKIKTLFTETASETYGEAIHQIGSAMNELAASGTSSESNIADFTLRVGALPSALKPSLDAVLGLGAAFEEAGIDSEVASSGFSVFMKLAGRNIGDFAKAMHMGVEEAKKLLDIKPEEFFLRFAEGMKGMSADETANVFKGLRINTMEVQKAVGAAANKTEEFRAKLKMSNEAMYEATSLSEEFNRKNSNAPAIVEKIKNAWKNFFASTNLINRFEKLIQLIGWLTGITDEAGNGVQVFKDRVVFLGKAVAVAVIGLFSYHTALLLVSKSSRSAAIAEALYGIAVKANELRIAVARSVTLLYAAAKATLTGNTLRAAAAMRLFHTASMATPLGLLVGLIGAVAGAFVLFNKEAEKSIKVMSAIQVQAKVTGDINKRIAKEEADSVGELRKKTELYIAILKDKNSSLETRKKAYEALTAIHPSFKGTLDEEYRATNKLTDAYNGLIAKLKEAATVRAYEKLLDEAADKRVRAEQKAIDTEFKKKAEELENKKRAARNAARAQQTEQFSNMPGADKYDRMAMGIRETAQYEQAASKAAQEHTKAVKERTNAINYENNLLKRVAGDKKLANGMLNNGGGTDEGSGKRNADIGDGKTPKDKKDRTAQQMANDMKDAASTVYLLQGEMLKKQQEYELERLNIYQDSREKELQIAELKHKHDKQNMQAEREERLRAVVELRDKMEKTRSATAKEGYARAIQEQHNLIEKSHDIEATMEDAHRLNLLKIREKWDAKDFEEMVKIQQREIEEARRLDEEQIIRITTIGEARLALSQMTHLKLTEQELSNIKTLEDAKKALREDADRAYLDSQLKVFNEQRKLLDELLKDPSLSPEAVEKLKKDLHELQIRLTQLTAVKIGKKEEDDAKVVSEGRDAMSQIDILGFSATQWADTFSNLDTTEKKLAAVKMGVQALNHAFSMFAELQNNLNQKELSRFTKNQDKKKKALLKQLNEGHINQEEYHKGVQLLEEQTDTKKREIAVKQAKMQRLQAVAQIAINTASAIMSIWAQVPKFDFGISAGLLTGMVSGLGAVQAGIILSQRLPEFASGGFTGAGFGSPDETGYKPAGIVHENEWVAPEWMTRHPRTARVIEYLESVRTGKTKPMAEGGFPASNPQPSHTAAQSDTAVQYAALMADVKELLQKLYDEGIEARMYDTEQNGKLFKKGIKKFEKIENRAAGK